MPESWQSGGGLSPPPGQEGQAKCGGAKGQSLSHLPRWWLTWLLYFDLHGVLCSFIIVRVLSSIIISVIAGAWSWYMMGVHRCICVWVRVWCQIDAHDVLGTKRLSMKIIDGNH